jgi:hypothetical protein
MGNDDITRDVNGWRTMFSSFLPATVYGLLDMAVGSVGCPTYLQIFFLCIQGGMIVCSLEAETMTIYVWMTCGAIINSDMDLVRSLSQ